MDEPFIFVGTCDQADELVERIKLWLDGSEHAEKQIANLILRSICSFYSLDQDYQIRLARQAKATKLLELTEHGCL